MTAIPGDVDAAPQGARCACVNFGAVAMARKVEGRDARAHEVNHNKNPKLSGIVTHMSLKLDALVNRL